MENTPLPFLRPIIIETTASDFVTFLHFIHKVTEGSTEDKSVAIIKANNGCGVLPVGKEGRGKLHERGRPSAQREKIDGTQCLNELP